MSDETPILRRRTDDEMRQIIAKRTMENLRTLLIDLETLYQIGTWADLSFLRECVVGAISETIKMQDQVKEADTKWMT